VTILPPIDGLIVREASDPREIDEARRLHGLCFLEAGYVSRLDSRGMIDDDWVVHSVYQIAVEEATGQIVGTCRLIQSSERGFPIFEHFEIAEEAMNVFALVDPDRCVEVSALATRRQGLQNLAISAALYGAVWQSALLGRNAYMLATVDYRLYRILRRQFHFPFEMLGQAQDYMGSSTVPVSMYLPRAITERRERDRDELAFFSGSISLDEIDQLEIDLREHAVEYRAEVIDLREQRREFRREALHS
jgi:hypothetical protein